MHASETLELTRAACAMCTKEQTRCAMQRRTIFVALQLLHCAPEVSQGAAVRVHPPPVCFGPLERPHRPMQRGEALVNIVDALVQLVDVLLADVADAAALLQEGQLLQHL